MAHYFAVVDDEHDVKDPVTVIRVAERTGVTVLTDDAAWVPTTLLDRIEAGEVAYQVRSITKRVADRIQAGCTSGGRWPHLGGPMPLRLVSMRKSGGKIFWHSVESGVSRS